MKIKEDPRYTLAKEIFVKKVSSDFINHSNREYYKAVMRSSIETAFLFMEIYEAEVLRLSEKTSETK